MPKIIPVYNTPELSAHLERIPDKDRSEFIRSCVALQLGTEKEQAIAKATIELILMKSK